MNRENWLVGAIAFFTVFASIVVNANGEDFTQLSLDELMDIQVYSVSKKIESARQAAAAVFVLTSTDIERSGAGSVPELLKLVPGLNVSRMDAGVWSIGSRGFAGRYANKLLVLIDGRVVYNPAFAGVFWESIDLVLDDIEKIEVIKGPGGTMWGANAVNGIINIITKNAKETSGNLISTGVGSERLGEGVFRAGKELAPNTFGRAWGKVRKVGPSLNQIGYDDSFDGFDSFALGYRLDSELSKYSSITLSGDAYKGDNDQTMAVRAFVPPYVENRAETVRTGRGNQIVKLDLKPDDLNVFSVQAYVSHDEISSSSLVGFMTMYDLALQHDVVVNDLLNISWGLNYRISESKLPSNDLLKYDDEEFVLQPYSGFLQADYNLTESLRFIVGTKCEHNDFTGWENQPSARFVWSPNEDHHLWFGYSNAVRTPSIGEVHSKSSELEIIQEYEGLPVLMILEGNHSLESENLAAYEVGYRISQGNKLSLDVELFHFDYSDLSAFSQMGSPEYDTSRGFPVIQAMSQVRNVASAMSQGGELVGSYYISSRTLFQAGYSYINTKVLSNLPEVDPYLALDERYAPRHQFSLRSLIDLGYGIEADSFIKFVDRLENNYVDIDSYAEIDTRLSWAATKNLKFEIVGSDFIHSPKVEYGDFNVFIPIAVKMQRSIFGKVTWSF